MKILVAYHTAVLNNPYLWFQAWCARQAFGYRIVVHHFREWLKDAAGHVGESGAAVQHRPIPNSICRL